MAGEYALSGALAERCLAQPIWGTDLGRLGGDLWTTTQALCTAGKVCQVHLGRKSSADGPPVDLGTALTQVLGSLFEDMSRNAPVWQRVRGWRPVAALGRPEDAADVTAPNLDPRKLSESFRLGLRNLQDLWGLVLPPATLLELKRAAAAPADAFALSDELWARAVFDFALGYRMRTLNRHHLLGAFMPLYLGWLASFVRDMQVAGDVDRRAQRLCKAYGTQKPYLISRWRSPDRFNP
jgi:glucosylglycerate synthase